MLVKTTRNYSPNFYEKKRSKKDVKFLIFHYTGMKSESLAIKRLTDFQSEVASHYFIRKNGEIISLVPDLYIAWHAGKSSWRKYKSINKNSIGIEISNPGHRFGYENFSKKQIKNLIKLSKYLIKKYKIKKNLILGHSDISPDRKKDPGEKFPWKFLSKNKIGLWHNLDNKYLKKFRRLGLSGLEKKMFLSKLKLVGYFLPGVKTKYRQYLINYSIRSFQRRFRPELIDGIADKECLIIAKKLSKLT